MKAEELICLATARGVNLSRVGGAASEMHGVARERERTPEERKLGKAVDLTARGRDSRSYRRADWSLAELGQAAGGRVGGAAWLAVRYSIAGDSSCAAELWSRLASEATSIGRRDHWAPKVLGLDGKMKFFREELAQLVLDDDAHRQYFVAAPALYPAYMEVGERTWNRDLEDYFVTLKDKLTSWIRMGCAAMQPALRDW